MGRQVQIPEGTQDLLPAIAEEKRILEQEMLALFKEWGYQEIVTPTLEYFSTLSAGTGEGLQEKMYRLFDRRGKVLALRAEMTAPIARLVATKLHHVIPAKLCYLANLFRYEDLQKGRYREFYQAGLEFIGGNEPAVDAEVLALAVNALKRAGLSSFTIHIGHMNFFQGLCSEYQLERGEGIRFREALINRDFVTYQEEIQKSRITDAQKENLLLLPSLQEKGQVPKKAVHLATNLLSQEAVENIKEIIRYLSLMGVNQHCYVDLGIFRDLDYYSGMVFEAFAPDFGFHLCGGGRYDRLLAEFGPDIPACGFALGIDRLLLALNKGRGSPQAPKEDYIILFERSREETAYQVFASLGRMGKRSELEILTRPLQESVDYALKKGLSQLLYIGDSPPEILDRMRKKEKVMGYCCYELSDWRE